KFLQANYYAPKLFYINASIGEQCFMVDGNFFLFNTTKQKNVSTIAKMSSTGYGQTRYIVKLPLEKRISIGAHTGFGSTNYSSDFNSTAHLPFSSKYAIAGFTFFKARNLNFVVDDEREFKLNVITKLNLDAVFYFDRKI